MKIVAIKSNSAPKVGDVVRLKQNYPTDTTLTKGTLIINENPWCNEENEYIEKVFFYICDETAKIPKGLNVTCVIYSENKIIQNPSYLLPDAKLVIATNNPSIPLPQLSKQAIELIVEKNGELGEFDVKFETIEVPISSHALVYAMDKGEPDIEEIQIADIILKEPPTIWGEREDCTMCKHYKQSKSCGIYECKLINNGTTRSHFIKVNPSKYGEPLTNETLLQFPSNNLKELLKEETLEEAAKDYADKRKSGNWHQQYGAFIAGANWQKDKMYSEEEVKKLIGYCWNTAFQEAMTTIFDPAHKVASWKNWFEQNKK